MKKFYDQLDFHNMFKNSKMQSFSRPQTAGVLTPSFKANQSRSFFIKKPSMNHRPNSSKSLSLQLSENNKNQKLKRILLLRSNSTLKDKSNSHSKYKYYFLSPKCIKRVEFNGPQSYKFKNSCTTFDLNQQKNKFLNPETKDQQKCVRQQKAIRKYKLKQKKTNRNEDENKNSIKGVFGVRII